MAIGTYSFGVPKDSAVTTLANPTWTARKLSTLALILIILCGAYVRFSPSATVKQLGFDENYYRVYLNMFRNQGIRGYPNIARSYIAAQTEMPNAVIPPTRFLYLSSACLVQRITGCDPLDALHHAASIFTTFSLIVTALFAARIGGRTTSLGVTALMAFAPLQVQMAQRAYIDGFFAFWALLALWTLWENLQAPNHSGWLVLYAASLAGMVLTKENAAFVFIALLGIIALNRWICIGRVTLKLLLATGLGAAVGVITLCLLCGGIHNCIQVYLLNIQKSAELPYVIQTGDGPWYRYLLDMMIMNPVVVLLATGAIFQAKKKNTLYLILFVAISYLIMTNIKHGMNLRYTTIWDMPLCWLAFAQISYLVTRFAKRSRAYFLAVSVAAVCALEWGQYVNFFVDHAMYDPVTEPMLRVMQVINSRPADPQILRR